MTLRAYDDPLAIPLAGGSPRRRRRWLDGLKGRLGDEIAQLAAQRALWLADRCAASGLTAAEMGSILAGDAPLLPMRRLWGAVQRLRRDAPPPYDPVNRPW